LSKSNITISVCTAGYWNHTGKLGIAYRRKATGHRYKQEQKYDTGATVKAGFAYSRENARTHNRCNTHKGKVAYGQYFIKAVMVCVGHATGSISMYLLQRFTTK